MDEEKTPYKNPLAGLDLRGVQALLKERLSVLPHGYKLPYMQWYEDDFKSSEGVDEMAPLARLMYRQLLAKAWVAKEAPYLPTDRDRLFRLSDCPDEASWERYSGEVLAMFEKTKDRKKLFHPRQLLDYAAQIVRISANTINGKKGGRPHKPKETKDITETQIEPDANPTETQPELESESKPTPETKPESQAKIGYSETYFDGQEDLMKTERQIDFMTQNSFGKKAYFRGRNGEDLKVLILRHKGSSVERAYAEWCLLNRDNPDIHDPVAVFLEAADEYLSSETPLAAAARDPEVVSLARELSYVSSGLVAFQDKQRARLAEVLKEFSAAEIKQAFSGWIGDQDLSDPKNVSFLAGKFVQIADSLCYTTRRKKQESDDARVQRDLTAVRLQEEAEAERREREVKRKAEEESFDPLSE